MQRCSDAAMQSELAGTSAASRQIVAKHGGHYLQRDEPDLVSSAIRDLIAHIRDAPGTWRRIISYGGSS
jgi:hypothetical protein